jgi:pilus assembly protein CpaE
MNVRPLRGVLITSDPALRETVQSFARESATLLVALDLTLPFEEFSGAQVKTVRQAAPALVLLDIGSDQSLGLALARHLADAASDLVVVATGPALSAEMLLEAMRAGVAEFLPKPVTAQALGECLDRVRPRLLSGGGETPEAAGKVYAFFSAKGGSGSTTVAANVAIEVHRLTRRKTLVVDLDAELGEVSLLFGVQPQFNFVDLIQNFHRLDSGLLSSYIEKHESGVSLLSAPYHPDRAAAVTEDQIRQVLLYLRGMYDYVFVDTSKSFGSATLASFEQADQVFLVATADLPNLRNIQRALPLIRRVMPRGDAQIRLVLNRYDPDDEVSIKDVERSIGLPVYSTLSNDFEAVMRSINSGKPVVYDARSPFSRDAKALAGRLVGGKGTDPEEKPGLISRFTGAFRVARPAGPASQES